MMVIIMSFSSKMIIRPKEISEYAGISRSTAYRLMAVGEFPKLVKLSTRCVGWRTSDIDDFLEGLPAAND